MRDLPRIYAQDLHYFPARCRISHPVVPSCSAYYVFQAVGPNEETVHNPGGCGLGSGCCGPASTLRLFACCSGRLFCCSGLFVIGFLWFPSAASLTPCFLTPSPASSSALSLPSRSTCDGTSTHSCSALLLCRVSHSCCHWVGACVRSLCVCGED